jgi:ABC-type glucose/galactose transport system permease subunit
MLEHRDAVGAGHVGPGRGEGVALLRWLATAERDDPQDVVEAVVVATDGVQEMDEGVRHEPDPTCWQVAWLMLRVLAVSVVLGLVVGIVLGWGSVVVVQVK